MKGFEITDSRYNPPEILASQYGLTTLFFTPVAKKRPKPKPAVTRRELTVQFRELLEENNWTQAELSRHLGVSRAWVTKVLKDKTYY